jgi:hypothetical protein
LPYIGDRLTARSLAILPFSSLALTLLETPWGTWMLSY